MIHTVRQPSRQVLRPYQVEAIAAIERAWQEHQRVLLVMATGLGKTTIFTQIAADMCASGDKRALVLVDRIELVDQAVNRIRDWGIRADLEVADQRADTRPLIRSPIIISTVQTQRSGSGESKRRERFDPAQFSVVIVDEAHLSITPGTKATIDYYCRNPNLRVLGVTATPDRSDRKSLAQIYEHVAYRYDLRDAISDGWLVPITGKTVSMDIDLSDLDVRGGDYSPDELGEMLEQNEPLYRTAATLLSLPPTESTLVFCARVSHAERVCQLLNDRRPGCAAVVSGQSTEQERKSYVEGFRSGRIQFLCNCAVLTTGFDVPHVRCVAMVRPTKSRALFAQCIGRGTRPLPGIVDGADSPEERRRLIASSDKTRLLVLTFVGMGGGVDLIGPEDVLAGDDTPIEAVRRAKKAADSGIEHDVEEGLQRAERDEEEIRHRLAALKDRKRSAEFRDLQLFKRGGAGRPGEWSKVHDALSSRQLNILYLGGFTDKEIAQMDIARAKRGVDWVLRRWNAGLCTWRQYKLLSRRGYQADSMTKEEATRIISEIAEREGWRRHGN